MECNVEELIKEIEALKQENLDYEKEVKRLSRDNEKLEQSNNGHKKLISDYRRGIISMGRYMDDKFGVVGYEPMFAPTLLESHGFSVNPVQPVSAEDNE